MCILFIAYQQHPDFPLIIAANRDEFHERPTSPSMFWEKAPNVLAGTDLQAGGTWMGINKGGKIAALTNIRDPQKIEPDAKSRGMLVSDFLINSPDEDQYLKQLQQNKEEFNGYNLLFGNINQLHVYNNHLNQHDKLQPGFYGLSNAYLNSPWPKINSGVQQLEHYCESHTKIEFEPLMAILRNDQRASDELLPETGVPIEWERLLSSIFICTEQYGTRSSTILLINNRSEVQWYERSFVASGEITGEQSYQFLLSEST